MARTKNFDTQIVLEKALKLFWEKGYHATSIEDLVQNLGINRASLYDTFGDKHQLFLQVLEKYRQDYAEMVIKIIAEDRPIREKLDNLLSGLIEANLEKTSLNKGCMMVNTTTELALQDPIIAEIVLENRQKVEEAFSIAFEIAQDKGEISNKHNSKALASFYFSIFNGLQVNVLIQLDKMAMENVKKVALSVLDEK
jgi:TetR/AcrR family transcriptional repressor of nem operon